MNPDASYVTARPRNQKPKEFPIHMMRTIAIAVSLASGLVLSAAAQTPATSAAPAKVAVISFQAAVSQTNEFQRNFADLQKKYDPKRRDMKTQSDEIEGLEKQLQAQADKLSESEAAGRTKTIDDKKKLLKRSLDDAQADFQKEMQDLYGGVANKVGEVMDSYVKQHGYTLVVDNSTNEQQAPLVLFASPSSDITKAVIDAYNLKSGVPAPAAQPAAAAPKPAAR
jgi:outer membrane protein